MLLCQYLDFLIGKEWLKTQKEKLKMDNYYTLPNVDTKVRTVILANGAFPEHEIPLSILTSCDYVICCDGATNQLVKNTDRLPDVIVGDLDSLTDENRTRFSDIVYHIREQETNDLTKAVKYCIEKGYKHIIILGATGKREDHMIANISLLSEYIDVNDLTIEMITDYGVFNAIKEDSTFESYRSQQISIFQIDNKPLTTKRLRYPIENRVLINWWQGTLNEAEENSFDLITSGKTIVFRTF